MTWAWRPFTPLRLMLPSKITAVRTASDRGAVSRFLHRELGRIQSLRPVPGRRNVEMTSAVDGFVLARYVGKRRVGTSSAGDRSQRDATDQSDQHHDRQKAGRTATRVRPVAKPGDSEGVVHCTDDLQPDCRPYVGVSLLESRSRKKVGNRSTAPRATTPALDVNISISVDAERGFDAASVAVIIQENFTSAKPLTRKFARPGVRPRRRRARRAGLRRVEGSAYFSQRHDGGCRRLRRPPS